MTTTSFPRLAPFALALLTSLPCCLQADQTSGNPDASGAAGQAAPDQTVKLSDFVVTAGTVGPYQVAESTSGSRVRMNLFDSTQSIYVATSQFIADTGAGSALDALQYFPGVSASTEPQGSGAERITFRGFQVINSVIDGIDVVQGNYFNRNAQWAMIDRLEVVMGADSILSPTGVPGGTLNTVTKKPEYSNFGSAEVQAGRYNTNRAALDLNRDVNQHLAIRVITSSIWDDVYDAGYQHTFNNLTEASWRFDNGNTLTLQHNYDWGLEQNGAQKGIPLNPDTSSFTYATLFPGLSPDAGDRLWANQLLSVNQESTTLLFVGQFNDYISTHFGLRVETFSQAEGLPQISFFPNSGGAYNPQGEWVAGETFGAAPTFLATPVALPGAIFTGQSALSSNHEASYTVQDDYAFKWATGVFQSQTLAGAAANYQRTTTFSWVGTSTYQFNIFTDTLPSPMATPLKLSATGASYSDYLNMYVNEVGRLFGDRIVANLGVAKTLNFLHVEGAPYATHPCPLFVNGGLLVKLVPDVALYYNHSESATPQNEAPTAIPYIDETTAKQNEEGVRIKFLNGHGMATVSYYSMTQSNYPVINPLNETTPVPVPAFPQLAFTRIGRGWEYNVNCAVTDELSGIISYTNFISHDPYGVPFRSTAENSGAGWIHYERKSGTLSGLAFGVGYVHRGKVPGDTPSPELATGSTTAHIIPNESSFYLPASGIWNVTASYKLQPQWTFRVFVDNVFNDQYIAASIQRAGVFPGRPINPRMSVDYSF